MRDSHTQPRSVACGINGLRCLRSRRGCAHDAICPRFAPRPNQERVRLPARPARQGGPPITCQKPRYPFTVPLWTTRATCAGGGEACGLHVTCSGQGGTCMRWSRSRQLPEGALRFKWGQPRASRMDHGRGGGLLEREVISMTSHSACLSRNLCNLSPSCAATRYIRVETL